MDMLKRSCFFVAGLCLIVSCSTNPTDKTTDLATPSNPLPNIVFLLIDDLGMSSIPYCGNPANGAHGWTSLDPNGDDSIPYELPNITAFAQESRVYTNMYATALCAPSRGELITGRYPFRNGLVYPQWAMNLGAAPYCPNNLDSNNAITTALGYLNTNQVGYPAVLQAMGYNTAFGGKWNLRFGQTMCQMDGKDGGDSASYMDSLVPLQAAHLNAMGFDQTFGPVALLGNTIDYYPPQLENAGGLSQQYLSNTLQNWMETTLIKGRASGQPQYIHYCFGLIHDPYGGAPCEEYGYSPPPSDSGDTDIDSVWAAKVEEVDLLIGQFVQLIDSLDSVNGTSTLIIVAGDNGTEDNYYSNYNGSWVPGGKATNTSNGSRVPFMVRWPGTVNPGIDLTLADFTDIFPTMVELAGGTNALNSLVSQGNPGYVPTFISGTNAPMTSQSYVLDGQSLLYEMTNGKWGAKISPRQAVYAQYQANGLLANAGYKLGITSNAGFYSINDETLGDSAITMSTLIQAIGQSAAANPFQQGTANYANYGNLVSYYNLIFPNAAKGN